MSIVRDFRYAVRALRASPAFAVTSVLTLALAIGANTVVLSVVDRVLLRPLPYADAGRLVTIVERNAQGGTRLPSYPTFRDWEAESRAFSKLGFARGRTGILATDEGPARLTIAYVTPGFLDALGAGAALGRGLSADENEPGGSNVAILSDALWRSRFGADRSILNRSIDLDGTSVTVIGIMPGGVSYPAWAEIWRPIASIIDSDPALARRAVHADSRTIGRLRPGATLERALAELATIQSRLAAEYPDRSGDWSSVQMAPLRDEIVGDIGPSLLMLGGAVLLVLLIACSNVASLSLARASSRSREMAIRTALGASRARLALQVLAESCVLGLTAGALGLLLSLWTLGVIRAAAPAQLPRAAELVVDFRVVVLALSLSLLAAVLFGIAPALRRDGAALSEALRDGRHSVTSGRRSVRLRAVLTAGQMTLAVMLLIGAGLLIQSFRRLREVDLGFDPERVVVFRVWPPSPRYDSPAQAAALYDRIIEAASAVPGVSSAAVVNHPPLAGGFIQTRIRIPGRPEGGDDGGGGALYKTASARYLETMGMRLLRGRWFTDAEMASPSNGIVISDAVAGRYWPNGDALGKPITVFRSSQARPDFGQPIQGEVIGVVASPRHFGLESDPTSEIYLPYTLETWPHIALVARTSVDPASVIPALRRAVLSVDPSIPVAGSTAITGFSPMARFLSQDLATRRYSTWLLIGFAGSALLLAVIGVYGILAYSVARRTQEMGVRLALGASPRSVLQLVMGQGMRLVVIGTAVGVAGALALTRLLSTLLYGTSPTDPLIFVAVPTIVVLTAVVACLVPALRAARLDPTVALRSD